MITAGVSTASLYPLVTEKALHELAVRGIDLVEIFINSDCELSESFTNQLKSTLDCYGMNVSSIHPYTCAIESMMFFTQYPRRFFDVLDYYKKYFEVMNKLGANFFVFHGNKEANNCPSELYFERYEKLFQVGKSFGITVAQENVARCSCGSIPFLRNMISQLGEDVKIVLDTKQAVRRGYDPYEFLSALGSNIVHIHASDYDDTGDCLLLGEGKLNYVNLVNKLIESSYTGSIILEFYSNCYTNYDELSLNLSYLKGIIDICCKN